MPRPYKRPGRPQFKVPDDIDPASLRQQLGYSQARFAAMLGVSVRTIQAWERRHWWRPGPDEKPDTGVWKFRQRRPDGAARVLLALMARDPWIIYDVLSGQLSRKTTPQANCWLS